MEKFPVFISQDLESYTEDLSVILQSRLTSPKCFSREAKDRGNFLNLFSDFFFYFLYLIKLQMYF